MRHRLFIIFILCGLALSPLSVHAQRYEKEVKNPRIMWTRQPNSGSGLYTTRNYFVAPGVSFSAGALYYYGDVDNIGLPFNGGFNVKNLGGGFSFSYQHPISRHCNLRVGLMGGLLGGDNTAKLQALPDTLRRDDYRKFQSVLVQPYVGVQYYPFSQAGFYLYGGVGFTASIITSYDFKIQDSEQHLKGSTYGLLPMVQLGLGYSWLLSTSWSMSAEIMVQQGLCDEYYWNLDAYPLAASQSSSGQNYGTGGTSYKGSDGKLHHKWSDGWFQVGITVTYQWRNCETCRTINNYAGIKPRKR